MSTPKYPAVEILDDILSDIPPKAMFEVRAHLKPSQQLHIVSSFICCHLVFSYWTGQSHICYCRKCNNFCQFPVVVVVVVFVVLLIAYCCCVLHNNKKHNYNNKNKTNENEKIHIN